MTNRTTHPSRSTRGRGGFSLAELMISVGILGIGLTMVERLVRISFWGLNGGLALMVVTSLFPGGVLQLWDVLEHGYWHARSPAFSGQGLLLILEWLRLPADAIFIGLGVVPAVLAATRTYWAMRHDQPGAGA